MPPSETLHSVNYKMVDGSSMEAEVSVMGQIVLWIVFLCMFVSFLSFFCLMRAMDPAKRLFHVYSTTIVGFASTAYLYMALGYGAVVVNGRMFHYARYLDWLVTTPLLLLDLGGLCNLTVAESVMLVALDVLMILAGLAGGLTSGATCFWMWLLGCIFYLPILYDLIFTFRSKAAAVGSSAGKTYNSLMGLTIILWTLYPVVFLLAEYGEIIPSSIEVLLYGILDVLAKCVFGFILLSSHDSIHQALSGYESIPNN